MINRLPPRNNQRCSEGINEEKCKEITTSDSSVCVCVCVCACHTIDDDDDAHSIGCLNLLKLHWNVFIYKLASQFHTRTWFVFSISMDSLDKCNYTSETSTRRRGRNDDSERKQMQKKGRNKKKKKKKKREERRREKKMEETEIFKSLRFQASLVAHLVESREVIIHWA